ncbi:MAG: hypothetical protein II054_02300 [Treponema sp.]|jgi:hypothetical protein|nr:hypothetical protein [Treponema sp.]MEE3314350.1 hypothetical protein [Treponema sp.]
MKKLVALVAVAVIGLASTFAASLGDLVGSLSGTWTDANYNANWTIGGDTKDGASIKITDAKTGKVYYTFKDSNMQDLEVNVGLSGISVSWKSSKFGKSYKITKGASLSKDLTLTIVRDWDPEPYEDQPLTYVGSAADVDGDVDVGAAVDAAADAIER